LLLVFLVSALSLAADVYSPAKITKWDKGTYVDGKKTKNWIVYQLQTDTTAYSIARHKNTKPEMQLGESVRYELKKKDQIVVIDSQGKKHEYQIVGQSAVAAPAAAQ
jgi:hypothetical protein